MSDTQQMSEVGTQDWAGWRRAKRAELLARRASLSPADHAERSERVLLRLEALALPPAAVVGFYWPFRAEIDVMPFIERLREQGRAAALPRVVGKGEPLEFRLWEPGVPMDRGVFGIPFPAEAKIVKPDLLIVPVVGFDRACYRLGYGGGYYDRTLAGRAGAVFTVGVGFALLEVDTILPQQHDVPLDRIVTEDAVYEAPL